MKKTNFFHWFSYSIVNLCALAAAVLFLGACSGMTDTVPVASPFDGEWYSPDYNYAFRIHGMIGMATLSNSPMYKVGDAMLRIASVQDRSFKGTQIFTDGKWNEVTGRLGDQGELLMQGGGFTWKMIRR